MYKLPLLNRHLRKQQILKVEIHYDIELFFYQGFPPVAEQFYEEFIRQNIQAQKETQWRNSFPLPAFDKGYVNYAKKS